MRLTVVLIALVALAGCDQKMADQPKRGPLATSPLFPDDAAARPPVDGTVATDADLVPIPAALPNPIPLALMQHGRDRFEVFCSPCHAYDGQGNGRVVQRGFPNPPDLHSATVTGLTDRQIFDVITSGYGVMFAYGGRVQPADRWAIVAYIRALQYSDTVPAADLTTRLVARLEADAS